MTAAMRAIAVATALCVTGCSFALVRAPATAEAEPAQWPRCTEHYFWQAVDGGVAALALAGVIYFATSDDDFASVGILVEGGIAAGFGTSAIQGLGKTKRCRRARAAYEKAAAEGR